MEYTERHILHGTSNKREKGAFFIVLYLVVGATVGHDDSVCGCQARLARGQGSTDLTPVDFFSVPTGGGVTVKSVIGNTTCTIAQLVEVVCAVQVFWPNLGTCLYRVW